MAKMKWGGGREICFSSDERGQLTQGVAASCKMQKVVKLHSSVHGDKL